jgi:hypothetical protein
VVDHSEIPGIDRCMLSLDCLSWLAVFVTTALMT